MSIGEHKTDEHMFNVIFPYGWSEGLCLRWLRLRKLEPDSTCVNANVYRWDSLYTTCPCALHGFWLQGWPLRWVFKKIIS
jgi:hypothetical protein